jgi:hypothetical protein
MMFLTALAAMIAALATPADPGPEPVDAVLAEILVDPWSWHGRTVRLSGHTNFCYAQGCSFCERDSGGEICVGLGHPVFRQHAGPEPRGGMQPVHEEALRWASLTITARYDATCSGENRPGAQNFTVCLDRATQLGDPIVEAIHAYRPADDSESDADFLRLEDDSLIALAAALVEIHSNPASWAFFQNGAEPDFFWLCHCRRETFALDDWPRTRDEASYAPGNPYLCSGAQIRDGRLTLVP